MPFRINIRLVATVLVLGGFAFAMKLFWLDRFSKATIQVQAEASAADWIAGFEQSVPDLNAILMGEVVRADQQQLIEATMAASAVFAVEFFDPEGRLLFDTSLPGLVPPPNNYDLNETAQWVARTGSKDLALDDGDTSLGEPELFMEAYFPFYGGQPQPIGVVELYIDVSDTAAALTRKYGWVGLVAILITALIFIAPGVAVVKQNEGLKQRDAKLSKMARTDGLTGLLNRRGADQELAIVGRRLNSGERAWLLQIDLDKFKPINDVFGHAAGDELLVVLAGRLQAWLGPNDMAARVGGDEFLVSRITSADEEQVKQEAEALRQELIKPVVARGHRFHVGASIGAAYWSNEEGQDITEAVRLADVALQTAKGSGRNQVIVFEPHMQNEVLSEARVAEDVADALLADQFTAHFQPIFHAQSEQLIGFEALARWSHPTRGILSPGYFLKAAKKAGFIEDIDQVVLEESLHFAKTLKAFGREDLQISLNLDDARLKRNGVIAEYRTALNKHGLSAAQFRLELVESTLLDERSHNIVDNLKRLHDAGFKIDLDDFGTGHTAIGSLRRFPVDRLKIDRSLVSGVSRDKGLAILTSAVASLGRKLKIEVVAEGIETQADLAAVKAMDVDAIQGFVYAEPMSAEQCFEMMRSERRAVSA